MLDKATLIWDAAGRAPAGPAATAPATGAATASSTWIGKATARWRRALRQLRYLLARFDGVPSDTAARTTGVAAAHHISGGDGDADDDDDGEDFDLMRRFHANVDCSLSLPSLSGATTGGDGAPAAAATAAAGARLLRVYAEQVAVAEARIAALEAALRGHDPRAPADRPQAATDASAVGIADGDGGALTAAVPGGAVERLLTLSRVSLRAGPGDLLAIVGQVGDCCPWLCLSFAVHRRRPHFPRTPLDPVPVPVPLFHFLVLSGRQRQVFRPRRLARRDAAVLRGAGAPGPRGLLGPEAFHPEQHAEGQHRFRP